MKFSFLSVLILCLGVSCNNASKKVIQKKTEVKSDSADLCIALLPTSDCFPFFYADDIGIYDSLGLKVRIVRYNSQMDCDTALIGTTVDGEVTDLIRARYNSHKYKLPLSVVMGTDGVWSLVSVRETRMKKFSQLKDRTMGIARFSMSDFLSDLYCSKGKLSENEIYRPQINDINLRMKMLKEKQIETAVLPEPQASLAVELGNKIISGSSSVDMCMGCLVIKQNILKNRKKQIQMFIHGYAIAANRLNKTRSKDVDSLLVAHNMVSDIDMSKKIVLPKYKSPRMPSSSDKSAATLFLERRNQVPASFVAPTFNTSFLK